MNAGFIDANPITKNEYVDDYEMGVKQSIGRSVQINADAFYYNYKNDEVPLGIPTVTRAGVINQTEIINVPSAISDGFEFSGIWQPIPHLLFSLTYGLDHTEITAGCSPFGVAVLTAPSGCFINGQDLLAIGPGAKPAGPSANGFVYQSVKGAPLPQAPENKVAFNANYTFYFDPGNLTLSGSYIWRDDSFATIFPTKNYSYAPSWSQVDLRATWSGNHDKYELVAYVKNLFDTVGYDAAYPGYGNQSPQGGGGYTFNSLLDQTPPRLFGAEVHYKF
jgi:iron complex outermembrane receptor protein